MTSRKLEILLKNISELLKSVGYLQINIEKTKNQKLQELTTEYTWLNKNTSCSPLTVQIIFSTKAKNRTYDLGLLFLRDNNYADSFLPARYLEKVANPEFLKIKKPTRKNRIQYIENVAEMYTKALSGELNNVLTGKFWPGGNLTTLD